MKRPAIEIIAEAIGIFVARVAIGATYAIGAVLGLMACGINLP